MSIPKILQMPSSLKITYMLMEHRINDRGYREILYNIGSDIADREKLLDNIVGYPEEVQQAIIDDECDYLEQVLGLAFVAAQIKINGIRSSVLTKNNVFHRHSFKKHTLLKYGEKISTGNYKAEIVNSFANYFKHGDESEWKVDWKSPGKSNAKYDIPVLLNVGAKPGSTGNFRSGASILGINPYSRVDKLIDVVDQWAQSLLEFLKSEYPE